MHPLLTAAAAAYSLQRGSITAAWERRTAENKRLAAKCLISAAGCTTVAEDLNRKRAVVDAEHAALVADRAADFAFRNQTLAIRDHADATLIASRRDRTAAEAARDEAKALLAEAEQVRADTLGILQQISTTPVTPLDAPEYALPQPTRWADPDPRFVVDMDNLFPPARDRVVIDHPEDGWLRVRVPDRTTELIEIHTERVPDWVAGLAPGQAVYAEVSVSGNPDSAFRFARWEHPDQAETELVAAEAGAR